MPAPAPVLYVTDLTYRRFDPADLFDLAYLLRSPDHDPRGVCLTAPDGDGDRVLDALALRAAPDRPLPVHRGADGLRAALASAPENVNVVIVGGWGAAAEVLSTDRALLREKGARLFLVGGHANDYARGRAGERLPIDPRLMQRHPERYAPTGDARVPETERAAWAALLTSGEGVIWLPRDICLWRWGAPGALADGGPLCEFLLRELFWANLGPPPREADRYDAASAPVLLSALPALLLAVTPDPFAWMRLFRVMTARTETDPDTGALASLSTRTDAPNLYAVIAIDGAALGKLLAARLRDRPLPDRG